MNKIDFQDINWAHAMVISKGTSSMQLMRIRPMTFIITNRETKKPAIAFESPALAYFIEKHHDDIIEVCIIEQKTMHSNITREQSEIHLTLEDQTLIILNQYDHILIARELKTQIRDLSSLYSPYKMWGIEPRAPFAFMLLTPRLVDYIDSISKEGQQQQLVYVLWRDYELERHLADSNHKLVIEGEFTSFSAKPFNEVLVVFDLI